MPVVTSAAGASIAASTAALAAASSTQRTASGNNVATDIFTSMDFWLTFGMVGLGIVWMFMLINRMGRRL